MERSYYPSGSFSISIGIRRRPHRANLDRSPFRTCGALRGVPDPRRVSGDSILKQLDAFGRVELIEDIRKELEVPMREYTVDTELRFPMHSYLAQAHSNTTVDAAWVTVANYF